MDMSNLNARTANRVPSRKGLESFVSLSQEISGLREVLWDIEAIGGDRVARQIRQLVHELETLEPSVTMIGQIKSGKTTLVNAMAGQPDLLPADVNPWTSVVTSLHINVPRTENSPRAVFRFFDNDEWDHLVRSGGRIGELAGRAGADKEVEKLRIQIEQMREKTRQRLGKKFELMLGQTHDYDDFDEKLIKRYVCMGDDYDELSREEQQGQFADITRAADLWLENPALPTPLCIRDTPGVNDTFMMREKITIRALRDSRVCCVVLSAHQALNSTDMGLIRLISNMKSRQVVVFVNRIDELSDPVAQVPEIQASLIETLSKAADTVPEIVFGSAYWAQCVLQATLDDMVDDSAEALHRYAAERLGNAAASLSVDEMVWQLSGMPDLYGAIGARMTEGEAASALASIRRRAANFLVGLRASAEIVTLRAGSSSQIKRMSDAEIASLISGIEARARDSLSISLETVFQKFRGRVDQVHERFIDRALESLLQHLEAHGEGAVWNYSPDGLRMLLRSSYQVLRKDLTRACGASYGTAASELTQAYGRIFDVEADNFTLSAPSIPETPPPVTLAQTIALDLKTSWWKSWWGARRGYRAFAKGFRELIEAETAPIVRELTETQLAEIYHKANARLDRFLAEQREMIADVCAKSEIGVDALNGLFGVTAQDEREELFELLFDELDIELPPEGEAA